MLYPRTIGNLGSRLALAVRGMNRALQRTGTRILDVARHKSNYWSIGYVGGSQERCM